MFKNVASQKIAMLAVDSATGRPKTGDAANLTAYVTKDWGAVTALTDNSATQIDATNAPGWYLWDLTQAETNAEALLFSGKSSSAGVDVIGTLLFTRPPNFTALAIDSNGRVKIQAGFVKNQALSNYEFTMTDSTAHNPATGKTVSVTRSIDGGAFGAGTLGAVTEVSDGVYKLDIPAADLNGNTVMLKFTASGCDTLFVLFVPAQ